MRMAVDGSLEGRFGAVDAIRGLCGGKERLELRRLGLNGGTGDNLRQRP